MQVNSAYEILYRTNNRFNILKGSAGAGKSHEVGQFIAFDALTRGTNWLVIRKVGATLKDSVVKLLDNSISSNGWSDYFKLNKTDREYTTNKAFIVCKGLDDPEKIKSIYGIDAVWIEEASELSEQDFNQLLLRLRGGEAKKRFYLTFNPISKNHWLKKRFFDIPPDDVLILETTYKDNAFLDAEYVKELESLKDIDLYYYNVYCLNQWGDIDNALIFHNYVVHDFEVLKNKTIQTGLDFGWNDPTAFEQCYIHDQELYIFNEVYKTGQTNTDMIRLLNEYKSDMIIADCSEPARIAEFNRNGYKVRAAIKGKDSIKMGLDYLKRFKKIHIHKSNCPEIAKEFQLYKYKQVKKDGEMIVEDEPLDKNNHGIDAIRYALEPFWNVKKPQINTSRRVF